MREIVNINVLSRILGIGPDRLYGYVKLGALRWPAVERYVAGGGQIIFRFKPEIARKQIAQYIRDTTVPAGLCAPTTGESLRAIITRECTAGKARHKAKGQPPVIEYADGKRAVVPAVRQLIDEAVALGKITKCPPMASPEPQSNVRMRDGRVSAGRASA